MRRVGVGADKTKDSRETEALRAEISALKAEKTALKAELEELEAENGFLKAEAKRLEIENTALKAEPDKGKADKKRTQKAESSKTDEGEA